MRPWATVSRGEWSVMTRYSWPSSMAVRAIDSIGGAAVGPQAVGVAVAPQRLAVGHARPRSAAPRWWPRARPSAAGTWPTRAWVITAPVDLPMPGRSVSVPAATRSSSSPAASPATTWAALAKARTFSAGARERSSR